MFLVLAKALSQLRQASLHDLHILETFKKMLIMISTYLQNPLQP